MTNANLYALFRSRFPADRTARFIETPDGRTYSYADLDDHSARYAALLLGLGLTPGDRVAVQVEKSPEAVFLYAACLRAGLAYLPLNTAYPPPELDYFIGNAEPGAVIARPETESAVGAIAARHGVKHLLTLGADGRGSLAATAATAAANPAIATRAATDTAAILYSSGTTGRPKGAMLSHRNLAANGLALHRHWGFGPGDVLLHALPIFHAHGLFVALHTTLLNGTGMIFCPRFDPAETLRLLPKATVFMGVPTLYERLLIEPRFNREACAHMRLFVSGSAPLLKSTFDRFRAQTGHTILERYGMTETGMNTSNPLDGERRGGTVGFPLPGVSLRIVDGDGRPVAAGETGALEVKGDNVFTAYWRMPDKTASDFTGDGYFRTGDLGFIDDAGYVTLVGRAKDLIITGGYNVYPKEVEIRLDALPGIAESAVIGLPDRDLGESVTAVIVRRADGQALTQEAVIARLKAEIAGYKVPKRVFFVDDLPRNAMGKIQKNHLRDRFAAVIGAPR